MNGHDEQAIDETATTDHIRKWSGTGGAENANFQPFVVELAGLLGVPSPDGAVPENAQNDFVFERAVKHVTDDCGETTRRIGSVRARLLHPGGQAVRAPGDRERPRSAGLVGPPTNLLSPMPGRVQMPFPVLSGPSFRFDESGASCRVTGGFERVMHGVPERVPDIVALPHGAVSFAIEFELHTANRPEPVSGTLNVRIDTSTDGVEDP